MALVFAFVCSVIICIIFVIVIISAVVFVVVNLSGMVTFRLGVFARGSIGIIQD